ncbi:MAG: antirestriction protein ArdA [Gallionellaceae bacterium]
MAEQEYSRAPARECAFFYVDGIPTKGAWLDLDDVDSWDKVRGELSQQGFIGDGYDGDILVADIEGALARCCYSSSFDLFDLDGFLEVQEDITRHGYDIEAVAAFIGWHGSWSCDTFESTFMGSYDSEEDFAQQYLDDTGTLDQIPESLRYYFDVERFARDLFIGDYYYDSGFVFCTNC